MGFSLSKLLGKKTSESNIKSNDTVDAIVKNVENAPYGISDDNVLYAGLKELGGYYMFQTMIVGALNVKTKKGATLTFLGDNFTLQLNSDMPEFESETSDVKYRYVTPVDFQVEESDIEKLQNATLTSICLNVKKQEVLFTKCVISEEEE